MNSFWDAEHTFLDLWEKRSGADLPKRFDILITHMQPQPLLKQEIVRSYKSNLIPIGILGCQNTVKTLTLYKWKPGEHHQLELSQAGLTISLHISKHICDVHSK